MSNVGGFFSEIGARISLIGAREAAAEATMVSDSIKGIGVASKETSVESGALGATTTGTTTRLVGLEAGARRVGTTMATTGARMRELGGIAGLAGVGLSGFGERLSEVELKGEGTAAQLTSLSRTIGIATVIVGGLVAYEGIKMATAFNASTNQIAASANISIDAASRISNAFLATAGTTTMSADKLSEAYAAVAGQLGNTEGHALNAAQAMSFMKTATDLAESSDWNLNEATTALSSVLQTFHMRLSQADTVANLLYNTSRLTNTPVANLVTTMTRLHSRLQQVTPSIADMSALTLDLADAGAKGSRGTMVVSGALATLLGNSKPVVEMLRIMGVHLFTASGHFVGMRSAIAQIGPELAKLSPQLQLEAERVLFGSGAQQLMGTVMLRGVPLYDRSAAAVTRHGVVQAAAAKNAASLAGEEKRLHATLDDLGVTVGRLLVPAFTVFIRVLSTVLGWFGRNRWAIFALAAVIGAILIPFMIMWIASMMETIALAAEFVLVFGPIVLGIMAVAIGIAFLATHWGESWAFIKRVAVDVWHFIYDFMHNGWVMVVFPFIALLDLLGKHWRGMWTGIKDIAVWVWTYFLAPIWEHLQQMVHDIIKLTGGLLHIAGNVGHFLGGIGSTIAGGFSALGFQEGGIVPGPPGAPQLIMAHGGEEIIPVGERRSTSFAAWHGGGYANYPASSSSVPTQLVASPGGGGQPIVVQLVVDRKVLAQAVYDQIRQDVRLG